MIKHTELRCGNWVYIPQYKDYFQIGQISENGRFTTKGNVHSFSSIECMRKVPLTEKWLISGGFTKVEDTTVFECFYYPYWVKNVVILLYNYSPPENTYRIGYAEMRCGKYHATLCKWIDSVHELQNFYLETTGQELTFTDQTTKG